MSAEQHPAPWYRFKFGNNLLFAEKGDLLS